MARGPRKTVQERTLAAVARLNARERTPVAVVTETRSVEAPPLVVPKAEGTPPGMIAETMPEARSLEATDPTARSSDPDKVMEPTTTSLARDGAMEVGMIEAKVAALSAVAVSLEAKVAPITTTTGTAAARVSR